MNPSISNLATQFNLDPDAVGKLLAEAARRGLVSIGTGAAGAAAEGGADLPFDQLKDFKNGRLPGSQAPAAYDEALTALGRKMELRDIPWAAAEQRPRIEGLPESTFALADAKEKHKEMVVSSADPPRLRHLGARILLKRAFLDHTRSFGRWVEADLAVDENEAAAQVKDGYDPVRPTARRNREVGGTLGVVELYLYGPAQQGAETRAVSRRDEKKLESKVGPAAHSRGVEDGMKIAAQRFEGAIDALFADPADPAPGATPPAPAAPGDRRTGNR